MKFESHCSKVDDGLYVSSELVAKNRDILAGHGITHVVNTIGFLCPNVFPGELSYLLVNILDSPQEDILPVLYDIFDFIEQARAGGGRVLVHCSQGVSRSAALSIAYMMWKDGTSYEETFTKVKGSRGVANPNIGFTCQLLHWHKRRSQPVPPVGGPRPASPGSGAPAPPSRVYRIAAFTRHNRTYLVPKAVPGTPSLASLDPRGAFVVQTAAAVFAWAGRGCRPEYLSQALRSAAQLARYEGAAPSCQVVREGAEPPELLRALLQAGPRPEGWRAEPVEAYSDDYEMYSEAVGERSPRGLGRCGSEHHGRAAAGAGAALGGKAAGVSKQSPAGEMRGRLLSRAQAEAALAQARELSDKSATTPVSAGAGPALGDGGVSRAVSEAGDPGPGPGGGWAV